MFRKTQPGPLLVSGTCAFASLGACSAAGRESYVVSIFELMINLNILSVMYTVLKKRWFKKLLKIYCMLLEDRRNRLHMERSVISLIGPAPFSLLIFLNTQSTSANDHPCFPLTLSPIYSDSLDILLPPFSLTNLPLHYLRDHSFLT